MVRYYCAKTFTTHDGKYFQIGGFYQESPYCLEAYLAGAMIPESTYIEQLVQLEEAKKEATRKQEERSARMQELARARLSEQERQDLLEAEKRERRLQKLLKEQRLSVISEPPPVSESLPIPEDNLVQEENPVQETNAEEN